MTSHLEGTNAVRLAGGGGTTNHLLNVLNMSYSQFQTEFGQPTVYTVSSKFDVRARGPSPSVPGLDYKRPEEIWEHPHLFSKGTAEESAAHFSDVNQGALGNCWLLAAMQAVARYGVASKLICSPLDASEPRTNVCVKLHHQDGVLGGFSTPFNQTVSTTIPCRRRYDGRYEPQYCTSDDIGEYWPHMVEKAVAAAFSNESYQGLVGGLTIVGLGVLLGGNAFILEPKHLSADTLFKSWRKLMSQGCTVSAAWKAVAGGPQGTNGEPSARYCGCQGLVGTRCTWGGA